MHYINKTRAVFFGAAAIAWTCMLFFFSGQSAEESGEVSQSVMRALLGWLLDLGADAGLLDHLLRKAAHAGLFAVQGFLLGASLLSCLRRRKALIAGLSGGALTAVANELHQLTAAERSCEVRDMLLDTAGAAVGLLAAALLMFLLHRNKTIQNRRYDHDEGEYHFRFSRRG